MLAQPPLFKNKKEFIAISLILITIIIGRLYLIYQDYRDLKSIDGYFYRDAQIIKVYKAKYNSHLFKLKSIDGFEFYIYSRKTPLPERFEWVRVKLKMKDDTTFFDFLKGFFAKGYILDSIEKGFNPKSSFEKIIFKQHEDEQIRGFYNAIFLAGHLDKELREKISALGVSHLVAMSGFHLGILWAIIYGLLYFPYRFLQERLFPWRHRSIDLGIVTLTIIGLFVLFVGAPPSIIRSYVMLVIGWIVLVFGFQLVSFEFLIFALLIILAFKPTLITSIGLLLSFAGVFYIFLILQYSREYPEWLVSLIIIPFAMFVLMFPFGHYFFGATTPWQLISPLLSIVFTIFYPIVAILHFIGLGWIFDPLLKKLFELPTDVSNITIPNGLMIFYILLSIWAVFSKRVYCILLVVASLITIYYIGLSI
jgi:competence protein ComEC